MSNLSFETNSETITKTETETKTTSTNQPQSAALPKRKPRPWRLLTPTSVSSTKALASPPSDEKSPIESLTVMEMKMSSLSGDDMGIKDGYSFNRFKTKKTSGAVHSALSYLVAIASCHNVTTDDDDNDNDNDISKKTTPSNKDEIPSELLRDDASAITFSSKSIQSRSKECKMPGDDPSTTAFSSKSIQSQSKSKSKSKSKDQDETPIASEPPKTEESTDDKENKSFNELKLPKTEQAANNKENESLKELPKTQTEQTNNETNIQPRGELSKAKPANNKATGEKKKIINPFSFTLGVISGIGSAAEKAFKPCTAYCEEEYDFYEDDDVTLDTIERDRFLDELDKFDRMNSFDTFGTYNTRGTVNTLSTFATNATNDTGASSVVTGISHGAVDDDGNVIPAEVINKLIQKNLRLNDPGITYTSDERKKRKKKKKKKRRRTVGFEYPPISKVREVPRVNSDEKKKLFFDDNELDSDPSDDSSSGSSSYKSAQEIGTDNNRRFLFGKSQSSRKDQVLSSQIPIAGSVLRKGKFSVAPTLKPPAVIR